MTLILLHMLGISKSKCVYPYLLSHHDGFVQSQSSWNLIEHLQTLFLYAWNVLPTTLIFPSAYPKDIRSHRMLKLSVSLYDFWATFHFAAPPTEFFEITTQQQLTNLG